MDLYACVGRPANNSANFIDRRTARVGSYVQSDIRWDSLEMIGEFFVQAIDNHGVPDSVDAPHFADVPCKSTIINKASQGHLERKRPVPVCYLLCFAYGRAY